MRGYYPTQPAPDGDYRGATLGQDALALITALGAQQAIVIGHDWGALAAYAAVAQAPDRVSRLVVVAIPHPAAITPDAVLGKAHHFLTLPLPGAARAYAADDIAGVDRTYASWSPGWRPTPAQREATKACFRPLGATEAILGYYRSFARERFAPLFGGPAPVAVPAIALPSLVIYGREDGAVEQRFFDAGRAYFTGPCTTVALDGVGHFPQAEDPAHFNAAVLDFLASRP